MRRLYATQNHCPVARSLDLLGERWTILVMRDLLRGTVRFSDLLVSLRGISPNLLAARLKLLESRGMVERRFYSDHPPRAEYRLTEKGRDFGEVVRALYDWGTKWEPRRTGARANPQKARAGTAAPARADLETPRTKRPDVLKASMGAVPTTGPAMPPSRKSLPN